jgi:hypothetical protein
MSEKGLVKYQDSAWFQELISDCRAIATETRFTAQQAMIEGYHGLGERIRQDDKKMKISDLVYHLAGELGMSERNIWTAVQFYDKFPVLDEVPGFTSDKSLSWSRVKKLLSTPKPELECEHSQVNIIHVCRTCGRRLDK